MPARSPTLDIRNLSVRYPGTERDALHDVTARVEAGSILAVAGPNGAGKSTMCLAAAGLLPRVVRAGVRGSVTVAGTVATEPGRDGSATLAGLVLGDPAAGISGARSSVREEVAFGLENLGVPRAAMDARIDQALAMLGI